MAQLDKVFDNFADRAIKERSVYNAKLLANNVVHKQFPTRHDSASMWRGANMANEAIDAFIENIRKANRNFNAVHVRKTTPLINAFPYLINGPAEYFVITDLSGPAAKIYSIYVTPLHMDAF